MIGSDDLSPVRRKAITWTNDELFSFITIATKFSEVLLGTQTSSFMEMYLKITCKMSAFLLRSRCVNWYMSETLCCSCEGARLRQAGSNDDGCVDGHKLQHNITVQVFLDLNYGLRCMLWLKFKMHVVFGMYINKHRRQY